MHHISIIIVNYDSEELTKACIKSLDSIDTTVKVEVVVVDNGSQNPFVAPKKTKLPVTVLRSESNQGFTGGNNVGIHHAIERSNSDYVLLLNNDTQVSKDFLQKMYDWLLKRPEYGMVCPKIYFSKDREFHQQSYTPDQKGKVLWYAGGSIDWQHMTAFHRGVDEVDRNQFANQTDSDFCTGCCVLIKREVLEKIGFLDADYFLYFEDVDLSMKARSFSYKIGYTDDAHIWHENAGSSNGPGSVLHLYYQTRNRLLFFWRYGDLQVKRVILKLLTRYLNASATERKAALHFVLNQYGKQPIL